MDDMDDMDIAKVPINIQEERLFNINIQGKFTPEKLREVADRIYALLDGQSQSTQKRRYHKRKYRKRRSRISPEDKVTKIIDHLNTYKTTRKTSLSAVLNRLGLRERTSGAHMKLLVSMLKARGVNVRKSGPHYVVRGAGSTNVDVDDVDDDDDSNTDSNTTQQQHGGIGIVLPQSSSSGGN